MLLQLNPTVEWDYNIITTDYMRHVFIYDLAVVAVIICDFFSD